MALKVMPVYTISISEIETLLDQSNIGIKIYYLASKTPQFFTFIIHTKRLFIRPLLSVTPVKLILVNKP